MHITSELVDDPVSHISISGIHGGAELDDRLSGEEYDEHNGNGLGRLVAGALIGAAVMYLFDPDRGTRRRALIRDRFVRAGHSTADRLGKVKRDSTSVNNLLDAHESAEGIPGLQSDSA